MSRPNDILIEWAEEQYETNGLRPESFVPLNKKPHAWKSWLELKKYPQFSDIIHECLTQIPWEENTHPVGVKLKLVFPFVYTNGWDGLFKDISAIGFLPLLVTSMGIPREPTWQESRDSLLGKDIRRPLISHMIVPTENDAILVAAMMSIFDVT